MKLHSFTAKHFRNIEACDIEFHDGVQLLSGYNAQGKTNAVEGIYLFARGKSFRAASDKDMVMFGSDGFHISIDFENNTGRHTLSYAYVGGQRRRKLDGNDIHRITDMMGHFRAILFTPDHLRLVKDSPEERRSFLNIGISQCYPLYVKLYADYKKALDERNCLLKYAQKGFYVDKTELASWSDSLALYSADIYTFRKDYIRRLSRYAEPMLSNMTDGDESLEIRYKHDIREDSDKKEDITEQYRAIYERDLSREISAGSTLFGPNRDDMDLTINGQSVRSFASQGQQRSVVLALKQAEGDVCREVCGEYPVYILDDVMSELDEKRRSFLMKDMEQKQMIVTSCEPKDSIYKDANVIYVEKGMYVSSHR